MSLQDRGRAHNLPQDRRRDCQYKKKGSNSNPSYPQPEGTEPLSKYDEKKPSYSAKLHQALSYMLNNWEQLIGYVNVGNVLIDNNAAERAS